MPPGTFGEQDGIESTIPGNRDPQGEGDELSTMRIVWDLADSTNEAHDRVSMGAVATYQALVAAKTDQLGGFWNYLYNKPGTTDTQRAAYGGIFQINSVSPDPTASPVNGQTLTLSSVAPQFSWLKGNDDGDATKPEANDVFGLIVWNATMTQRLLDFTIAGNVTSYQLTPAQWAILLANPGLDNYVITGLDDQNNTAGVIDATYWSDAYQFTVVPEPTMIGVAASGVFGLIRRRRRAI